jgi:hypothetical protein
MRKPLAEQHPELVHYTSAAGLAGILRSQTLRATHYAYLNDAAEVKHFLEFRLPELLRIVIAAYLKELVEQDQTNIALIAQQGGELEIADRLGKQISASMLNSLLRHADGNEPLAEPYVASFCTVRNGDNLVSQHGLLSQWRGYGQDGGYAIVLDTADLSQLLEEAGKRWENGGDLFGGDIVYSSDSEETFLDEFADALSVIKRFFSDHLKGREESVDLENIYFALMECACRYKHWGFKEENEVRIIVIPNNNEILELARTQGITVNEIPRKHYMRFGKIVPFIELFEGITSSPARPLPILRIIVGPSGNSHEQIRRIRAAEILLGQHGIKADVSASEIPYIG